MSDPFNRCEAGDDVVVLLKEKEVGKPIVFRNGDKIKIGYYKVVKGRDYVLYNDGVLFILMDKDLLGKAMGYTKLDAPDEVLPFD